MNDDKLRLNQPDDTDKRKEFGLSTFSIDNNVSVMVLLVIVSIMGLLSYVNIPKEAEPDITIPNVIVITTYPGVSPEDMESLVTQKLEDELTDLSNVKQMNSTTSEGYSSVNIEFNTGINMDEALQKVREKVDMAKPKLPSAAEDPIVQEINISEFPIMQVNLAGEYSLERLKKVAEDLQDRLETIPEVLEVDLAGGLDREVKIDIDLSKMKYHGVSFKNIIEAIQNENVTIPGGNIEVGSTKYLVRVPGEFKNPELMKDIVIKTSPEGFPIFLRDIANVDFGYKERTTYARLDGLSVITLSVKKRSGRNMIETAQKVRSIIDEESPSFPPTTTVAITGDRSKDVVSMVANLENNIISGLILVVGVLLFFLGVRNASFVGISIPLSMFLAFIIISAVGMTMNMIVLFSLILALGMLVDNAIVVVENIYRYLEEGYDNITAAKKGTGEVAIPIITGTLTTLGAFLPLVFWDGVIGEFMGYLPKTLIITLASSLFVGLVINPVLCALYMKLDTDDSPGRMTLSGKIVVGTLSVLMILPFLLSNPTSAGIVLSILGLIYVLHKTILEPVGHWWQLSGIEYFISAYTSTLKWALNHRLTTLAIMTVIFFTSFGLYGTFNAGTSFFPETIPPANIFVQVEAPVGTKVDYTDTKIAQIEGMLKEFTDNDDFESVVANSGAQISTGFSGGGSSENAGTISINFVDFQVRKNDAFDVLESLRRFLPTQVVGADVVVEKPQNGPPTGKPINLEIIGDDIYELKNMSDEVLRIIQNSEVYGKLEGLDTNLPDSRPELTVNVDREKAIIYGLNTQKIGNTIRQAINGVEVSKFRDGENEYDVTVRLRENDRRTLDAVGDLNILTEAGIQVPLSEVATWYIGDGFGGIKRKNGRRTITVSSDVRSEYQANAVLTEVQEVLAPFKKSLPQGYIMQWTGQQEEQEESQQFLITAFLMALFLISFILVAQFNSIVKPIIVMTSVIMSVSGVLYGLMIFQTPFVIIMTGIGIISLAGVVVNNAIVLIDYVDILRSRDDMSLYDALMLAGKTRFRPVVLTAVTTILGLVPLAIGFNFDFLVFFSDPLEFFANSNLYIYSGGEQKEWWSPMAVAVIVGLGFATLLTLVVVPVLYSTFDSLQRYSRKIFLLPEPETKELHLDSEKMNGMNGNHTNGNDNGYSNGTKLREAKLIDSLN